MATLTDRKRLRGKRRWKYVQDRIKIIARNSRIPECNPGVSDGEPGPNTDLAVYRMKRSMGYTIRQATAEYPSGPYHGHKLIRDDFIENLYRPWDRRFMESPGQWARGAAYRAKLRADHSRRLKAAAKARKRKRGASGALNVARASAQADGQGRRRSFYSQAGAWTVNYAVSGEPRGYRSDCSQWFTSCYKAAGLPDPNGNDYRGGYTGTLGAHGRKISRAEARHTPGAAVLFGTWPYHHVEMAVGDGSARTIGHGSARVDYGSFDLLGGPKTFIKYV